jgi:hypothetical protein
MKVLWKNYQEIFDYAEGINWEEIMKTVKEVYTRIGLTFSGKKPLKYFLWNLGQSRKDREIRHSLI